MRSSPTARPCIEGGPDAERIWSRDIFIQCNATAAMVYLYQDAARRRACRSDDARHGDLPRPARHALVAALRAQFGNRRHLPRPRLLRSHGRLELSPGLRRPRHPARVVLPGASSTGCYAATGPSGELIATPAPASGIAAYAACGAGREPAAAGRLRGVCRRRARRRGRRFAGRSPSRGSPRRASGRRA